MDWDAERDMVADIISNVQSFFRKVNQRIRDGGALVCFLEEITDRDKGSR